MRRNVAAKKSTDGSKTNEQSRKIPAWFSKMYRDLQRAEEMTEEQLFEAIDSSESVPMEFPQQLIMRGQRDALLRRYQDDQRFCHQIRELAAEIESLRDMLDHPDRKPSKPRRIVLGL
jgi:predicted RNA polymerase sigma factor